MALTKQNALVMVMLLAPVICCFVGIGAFVHVILAAEQSEQQQQLVLREQMLKELAELQQEEDNLQKIREKLLENVREIEAKIRELADKLLRANRDDDTARKIKEEILVQKKLRAKLLAESAGLKDQIAQKKKHIEELMAQIEKVAPLEDQQKELQSQMQKLRNQAKQVDREHGRLKEEADNLRLQREEEGKKTPIIPSKPLPPGVSMPVFVECTATAAIIQPQGTRLNANPSSGDRSRFLAAAKESGFVVFLVRPNGFSSFQNYRDLAQKNGTVKFGFEPVDASWKLIYPKQRS